MRWIRSTRGPALVASLFVCAAVVPVSTAGTYSYTLDQISPYVQATTYPVIPPPPTFGPPYFFVLLTNTAAVADSFHLSVQNLTDPTWFPQVCLRAACFPDSTTLAFAAGAADTVGVQCVPFVSGVAEWDFVLYSVGDPGLSSTIHMKLFAGDAAVGVSELVVSMPGYELRQNFPNPVRQGTELTFVLPREERVDLNVYDISGRLVSALESGVRPAGAHTVSWNGRSASGSELPAGVYFYRLRTPAGDLSKRMTLVR